jgi:hypothetical protein
MKVSIEWIACSERLPDDDERVLVVVDGDVWMGWYDSSVWIDRQRGQWASLEAIYLRPGQVTHWAHMPETPTQRDAYRDAVTGANPRDTARLAGAMRR